MKAITIWQPWASLILHGFKPYEFRGWHPGERMIGKRIAIHAGARRIPRREMQALVLYARRGSARLSLREGAAEWLDRFGGQKCEGLPHGAVIATAVLSDARRANLLPEFANDSDRAEHFNFAWKLEHVEPVLPPDECAGKQGWWDWSGAQLREIGER